MIERKQASTNLKRVCLDNCLAIVRPDVAKKWHPTENRDKNNKILTPYDFTRSSGYMAVWLCDKGILSEHKWNATIHDRTNKNSNCPYCAGTKVCMDNCLATVSPNLAREFHPTENKNVFGKTLSPYDVHNGSNKYVIWICNKGQLTEHKWVASIAHRSIRGDGCPFCSNKIVCLDNCLAITFPDQAAEWDLDENTDEHPLTVVAGAHYKAVWKCMICSHKWRAQVRSRTFKQQGCPKCYSSVSLPELFCYSQIKWLFNDTVNSKKIDKMVVDIFVESISTVIEYDGYPWHAGKENRDLKKTEKLTQLGFNVIRVRDCKLRKLNDNDIMVKYPKNGELSFKDIKAVVSEIRKIVKNLKKDTSKIDSYMSFTENDIPNYSFYLSHKNSLLKKIKKDNLETTHPSLAKELDDDVNGRLRGIHLTHASSRAVGWKCFCCGNKWIALVVNRSRGYKKCSNCFYKNGKKKPQGQTSLAV